MKPVTTTFRPYVQPQEGTSYAGQILNLFILCNGLQVRMNKWHTRNNARKGVEHVVTFKLFARTTETLVHWLVTMRTNPHGSQ
jgi:hypothetical protein